MKFNYRVTSIKLYVLICSCMRLIVSHCITTYENVRMNIERITSSGVKRKSKYTSENIYDSNFWLTWFLFVWIYFYLRILLPQFLLEAKWVNLVFDRIFYWLNKFIQNVCFQKLSDEINSIKIDGT